MFMYNIDRVKIEIGENMNAFKRFDFKEEMLEAVENIHFTHPTLVQERVIPKILKGNNVIVQSSTGSGKSHAFLLPIINNIYPEDKKVQSIIIAPTRELARQLYNMASEVLKTFPEIEAKLFIGGKDFERDQTRAENSPHIVIGTPNRILELIHSSNLKVSEANSLVIDEADLSIDLGFLETIDKISNAIDSSAQFLVFSATIPNDLQHFLQKYLTHTEVLVIDNTKQKANIHYSLIPVRSDNKMSKVLDITENITPYLGFIFANSRERADELYEYLAQNGVNVGVFHGGLKPRERKQVINQIHNLEYMWVVASDLAARGLDFDGASHVINYDIPREIEFFTHRVGRVGRGEYSGVAITLYEPNETDLIDQIESKGYKFSHEDLIRGELRQIKDRKKRSERRKKEVKLDEDLSYKVRKPKKIKPGYKKKMKQDLEKLKRDKRKQYAQNQKRKNKKR